MPFYSRNQSNNCRVHCIQPFTGCKFGRYVFHSPEPIHDFGVSSQLPPAVESFPWVDNDKTSSLSGEISQMITRILKLSLAVLAISLVLLPSRLSFAQLHSRPASVMLIATLESLSVSATPDTISTRQVGTPVEDYERVEVKTSWAVPARRTTLRLFGGLAIESQTTPDIRGAQSDSSAAILPHRNGSKSAQCQSADCAETIQSGGGVLTLMTQAAGQTNRAHSRSNSVNLLFGKKNRSGSSARPDSARFDIRMEAL